MRRLSKTQRSATVRTCLTLGCGTGSLGALAMAHNPSAAIVIAVVACTALICCAISSLSDALPDIIAALSAKSVARIRARADAKVTLERTRQRTTLLNAGLDGKLDAALPLLKLQPLDADMLTDPRFSGDMLRAPLPDPRAPWETDIRLTVVPTRGSRPC